MKTIRLRDSRSVLCCASLCLALLCPAGEGSTHVTINARSGIRTLKNRDLRELKKAVEEKEKSNFERTQTFGQHFEKAQQAVTRADALMNGNPADYDAVQKALDEAAAEMKWLEDNEKVRAEYLLKHRQLGELQQDLAEQIGIAVSDDTMKTVNQARQNAAAAFDGGKMAEAMAGLKDSEKALKTLVGSTVEKLIEDADALMTQGENAKALELLKNGMALDCHNEALKAKMDDVRKLVVTTLKVTAVVDGQEVPAMVHVNGEWEAMPYVKDVPKGQKISLRVVYARGAEAYTAASAEYTCDWTGEKAFTVELKPVTGPKNRKGWTVEFAKDKNAAMSFEYVRPGSFLMGRPVGDQTGEIQHDVELRNSYWLGTREVTQRQWMALMEKNPSFNQESLDNPVENISWDDAMLFCRKLTHQERLAGRLPEGYVYTLPTEAQWEYACRAGSSDAYSFGDDDLVLPLYGNVTGTEDGFAKAAPAGSFRPNAWGFLDMHGNMSEWCRDLYGTYPSTKTVEPTGPADAEPLRIYRGGDWKHAASEACAFARDFATPAFHDECIGFRVALVKNK